MTDCCGEYIERAGVVVIFRNKILLVLGKYAQKWGIPKGEVLDNEQIIDAAVRELYEETGLIIDEDIKNLLVPSFSTKYTHYFKIDISNININYHPSIKDKGEIKKCKFMSFDALERLNNKMLNHDLRHFCKIIKKIL